MNAASPQLPTNLHFITQHLEGYNEMKKLDPSIPPVGISHRSCGKDGMMLSMLRQMQENKMKFVIVDPKAELSAFYEATKKQSDRSSDSQKASE